MYDIGDYVIVNRRFGRTKPSGNIVIWASIVLTKPRLGQIAGMKRVYDGKVQYVHDIDPGYFVPSKTHTVYLVRFGMLNKAICVEEQGMRLAELEEINKLPKLFTQSSICPDLIRRALSEDSKLWPRDKKGRWITIRKNKLPIF